MLTDREGSFASDLLHAAWTYDDAVIHDFIRKNKPHDPHPVDFRFSFYSYWGSRINEWTGGCKRTQQRACVCADELEYLPLDVLDTKTYHRISTNLKLGMCPHVYKFLKDPSLRLHKDFLQNRIEEWYEMVDKEKNISSETHSLIDRTQTTPAFILTSGANLGNILLRLDKRQVLSQYYKKYSDKYWVLPHSSIYLYDLLAFVVLTGREDFCLELLQRRQTRKQQLKESTIYWNSISNESILSDLIVEKNLKVFNAILKILEKKEKNKH